jgi:TonB family protein
MAIIKFLKFSSLTISYKGSFWFTAILILSPLVVAHSMEPDTEEIETLDVIEITGAVVDQAPRDLKFPIPGFPTHDNLSLRHLLLPDLKIMKPGPTQARILLDQTAMTTNLHTPVKPLKTERPLYPRRAREQGWHGRAIVRLKISPDGTVESSTIHESSGHQLLDDNAIKAAIQWTFEPAKNGGFPVPTTVNIPIQFDLVQ